MHSEMLDLPRDSYVLATKVLLRMGPGHNQIGLSRTHIMEGVDASLKRLQVDHIDLYQIHGRDPFTPMEETLDALDDCVRAGKVRYLGLCNLVGLGDHEIAVDLGQEEPGALREPADVLLGGGPRHRARDRAAREGSEPRHHAVEPAGRRIAVGQVFAREREARWRATRHARFPARGSRARVAMSSTSCGPLPPTTSCPSRRWRWPGCWRSRTSPR